MKTCLVTNFPIETDNKRGAVGLYVKGSITYMAPYIVINVPTNTFEIRYKFIRNLEHFDSENFAKDF